MASIIDAPAVVKVVPVELLEALANEATKPTTGHPSGNGQAASGHGSFDLEAWIAEHCPDARLKRTSDGEVWVLPVCAWDASHTGGCAHISRRTNGVIGAACKHNSCAGKGWHELRDAVEPGWRDRRPSRVDAVHGATGDGQGKAFDETDEWPAPLGDEAYHGLVGEFVRAIAPHTESDAVALIAQTLTAVGNVIGRTAFFRAEADRHFGNLDICLVGTTSKARKGSSAGQMKRLVRGVDRAWADEHVLSGLSSGEGLIHAVRDPTFKRVPQRDGKGPKAPIVGYEEVEADAGVKDKRLLVVESEFSSVLKQMLRERNILSAIIRQAWDSGDLRTLTKNSPTKATGAHISIIGHITRDELRRLITETEMANGLANRFLWFCARRSKFLPDGGTANTLDLSEYEWRLREAVQFAKSTGEVRRDDAARELWHAVYADLSGGKPGLLGAITSRAEAQVMRLALVYALLDCSDTIRLEHLTAALAVWEYAEASAAYAFGRALGDATADEILAALRRQAPKGMSRDEIRNHFGRNKPAPEIERALGVLFHEQLARCEKMTDTGGRPAEVWFVR
ncbi:MAG: hypothetical protein DCC68_15495 [Planctomycetota bacterium]|nr:MAG: hypothetical protein DCC68_15495 [Planctomycetota bacterium]